MTPAEAVPGSGFEKAVFVYTAAAALSFVASGSIFWRRRRFVARHAGPALVLASIVAAAQIVFIIALMRQSYSGYEMSYFHDTMVTSAIVLLPALFVSAFLMASSGAWLSEISGHTPFPVSRALDQNAPGRKRLVLESVALALGAGGVALAWSVALFFMTKRVTGHLPEPAPGTEDVQRIFSGHGVAVLGFGLAAAFWEEIFVRLFLLNALVWLFRKAQGGTGCAIVVSAAIWASGHAGTMVPEAVKFLQVFPIGLIFAGIYIRRGIETCLLAHSAFNVGILAVGGFQ